MTGINRFLNIDRGRDDIDELLIGVLDRIAIGVFAGDGGDVGGIDIDHG